VTPTTASGGQTRDAILTHSVRLASTEGLEGLTIGRLAGDLGLSKSGLFRHFGSKEDLQLATVALAVEIFRREVVDPVRETEPGIERLRAICDRYLGYVERSVFPGGCFWSAASAEFDGRPGPVRDAIREASAAWLATLEEHARIAGARDPEQLAFELHALIQEANWAFQLFGDDRGFERARAGMRRRLDDALPAADPEGVVAER
jgi:AcrR family transcriptional regulator